MEKIFLDKIQPTVSFSNIYGINQPWTVTKSWNCIDSPRPKHGLMYVFCDEMHITYKNKEEISFYKGNLLYFPKYSEYQIEFHHNGCGYATILLNFDIRDVSGAEYCLEDHIVRLVKKLPSELIDSMLHVVDCCTNSTYYTVPATKAFYDVIDKLINHLLSLQLLNEKKDEVPVLPAIVYLNNHITDDVSIPQLAQMCLLNDSAFRKAFREYTGMNPVQYKTYVKIKKAKLLLRSASEIPIEEIAAISGFYDHSYFHKIFVKQTGRTPKQYRNEQF